MCTDEHNQNVSAKIYLKTRSLHLTCFRSFSSFLAMFLVLSQCFLLRWYNQNPNQFSNWWTIFSLCLLINRKKYQQQQQRKKKESDNSNDSARVTRDSNNKNISKKKNFIIATTNAIASCWYFQSFFISVFKKNHFKPIEFDLNTRFGLNLNHFFYLQLVGYFFSPYFLSLLFSLRFAKKEMISFELIIWIGMCFINIGTSNVSFAHWFNESNTTVIELIVST